jgi:Rrf2 family protein
MKLGRESSYAIDGLLGLASKPYGTVMLLRDIAALRGVPQSFLAKIFQKLVRAGIVLSWRGNVRGYALARRPQQITVKDILLVIEGPDLFEHCIFWGNRCAEDNPCALHDQWRRFRQRAVRKLFEGTTLAKLANEGRANRERQRSRGSDLKERTCP